MKNDSVVIDMYSQREAIKELTKGWSTNEVLSWLKRYGEVREVIHANNVISYAFRSNIDGSVASFSFGSENSIVIHHLR